MHTSFVRVGQVAGSTVHKGIWNKTEWFPRLVLSSLCVGTIPDSLGPIIGVVNWVPVNKLAAMVVEMALGDSRESHNDAIGNASASASKASSSPGSSEIQGPNPGVGVFHATNPRRVSWDSVRAVVIDELARLTGKTVKTVPLREWIETVKRHGNRVLAEDFKLKDGELEAHLQDNPALKLMGFFETIVVGNVGGGEGLGRPKEWELERSMEASRTLREVEGIRDEWVRKWVREWIADARRERASL